MLRPACCRTHVLAPVKALTTLVNYKQMDTSEAHTARHLHIEVVAHQWTWYVLLLEFGFNSSCKTNAS